MSDAPKAKGRLQPASSQTSKNANCGYRSVNVRQDDGAVNNYRQFVLCTDARNPQVKAWLPGLKVARASIRPFISGYQLRAGVGGWFPMFATDDHAVVCWCTERVDANEPVLDLGRAAHGIRWVEQREQERERA